MMEQIMNIKIMLFWRNKKHQKNRPIMIMKSIQNKKLLNCSLELVSILYIQNEIM